MQHVLLRRARPPCAALALARQVGFDVTKQSPVLNGELLCMSAYAGPHVDFGAGDAHCEAITANLKARDSEPGVSAHADMQPRSRLWVDLWDHAPTPASGGDVADTMALLPADQLQAAQGPPAAPPLPAATGPRGVSRSPEVLRVFGEYFEVRLLLGRAGGHPRVPLPEGGGEGGAS